MGMYIWYGFLIAMIVVEAVYFLFRVRRFYFVQKLSKGNKKIQYAIVSIPVLVLLNIENTKLDIIKFHIIILNDIKNKK